MAKSASLFFSFIVAIALAHPGHDHSEEPTNGNSTLSDTANSSASDPSNRARVVIAWSMSLFALLGTFCGAIIPLIDKQTKKIRAKPERNGVETALLTVFRFSGTSRCFISGALGFSSGVLLFGALALVVPGCVKLFAKVVGNNASMVTFALWIAGCMLVFLARIFQEVLGMDSHHHGSNATTPESIKQGKVEQLPQADTLFSDNASMSTREAGCCEMKGCGCNCNKEVEKQIDIQVYENKNKVEAVVENNHLLEFGIMNIVVLALHKIPEGIVMFITLFSNPSFGFMIALALMVHNFPEAISISLPIYTATKSAWKALGSAMIVGLFQPIGAAIGFVLLVTAGFSDLAQALIYAPLSGMLTVIVVKGLLPTAFKTGPEFADSITTWVLLGIATMFLANSIGSYA